MDRHSDPARSFIAVFMIVFSATSQRHFLFTLDFDQFCFSGGSSARNLWCVQSTERYCARASGTGWEICWNGHSLL